MGDQPPQLPDQHSSFRVEITVAIGYQRKRATLGGVWEGHLVTIGLLLGSILVVLIVVLRVFQISLGGLIP